MLARDHWQRRVATLDADSDAEQVMRIVATLEFPWDSLQALSFALFRTYAVPSIGRLLDESAEFTTRVQKRYDETGMLLEAAVEHGLESPLGRTAVRRINQMHGRHDIAPADMRYVLATFVVVPVRWMQDWGYRPMSATERDAAVHYYSRLGELMGIPDVPGSYAAYAALLDAYEREHFAFDEGGLRVADSTLDLMTTFPPFSYLPGRVARRLAYCLMDEPLLDAFGYPHPRPVERRLVAAGMRARARLLARVPARSRPQWFREIGYFRTWSDGRHPGCPGPTGADLVRMGT